MFEVFEGYNPIPRPSRHLYGEHPQNEGRGVFSAFSGIVCPSLIMGFGVGAFQMPHLEIHHRRARPELVNQSAFR